MHERAALRLKPKSAVTVAIEAEDLSSAFGVVSNISEQGACLWTTGAFKVGVNLVLRLSFPREAQPLQAMGRVIWEDAHELGVDGALRYGPEWSDAEDSGQQRLRQLIAAYAS